MKAGVTYVCDWPEHPQLWNPRPLDEELRKKVRDKKERHRLQCERSLAAFDAWWAAQT